MSGYKFNSTIDPKKLTEVFSICAQDWGGPLNGEEFGQVVSKEAVNSLLNGKSVRAFYLETKEGQVACCCCVFRHSAFFKDVGTAGGFLVPDASGFGVNSAVGLRLSLVFTHREHRGKKLMPSLLNKVIEYEENDILKFELEKSEGKEHGFKAMVTKEDGRVDPALANYHLGKKYFWFLYSAVDDWYKRFGFKAFPADGYRIPSSLIESETHELVEKLLEGNASQNPALGKSLRLLDSNNRQDQELLATILQTHELELLTEINQNSHHTELGGGRRSSSSLTNMTSALSATRLSAPNLPSVSEQLASANPDARRQSAVKQFALPKFAVKPSWSDVKSQQSFEEPLAQKVGDPELLKYSTIKGALLTNSLQQKTYYILWSVIMDAKFVIIGFGELKVDLFLAFSPRRRSSSGSTINELGGYNLQDIEILLTTAVHVAKKRSPHERIFVSLMDLPSEIPPPVLHDFFVNYLPRNVKSVLLQDDENAQPHNAVEYLENISQGEHILPMLKRYGLLDPNFDVDWLGSGNLATWG